MTATTRKKRYSMPFGASGQSGSMLIVIVILLLLMSVLIGFMLNFTTTSIFGELTYNQMERAYFMAEAGGHYACPLVKQDIELDATYDDTYSLHNQTFTLDDGGTQDGQFTISVNDTDPANTLVQSTGLVSTGIFTDAEVTLTYLMAKTVTPSSPFDKALFSGSWMWLGSNVEVNGDVGTNAPFIWDLFGADISGTTETSAGRTLEQIPFSCGDCSVDLVISSDETWSAGTYEYQNVTINNNNTLTIDGDAVLYVATDFVMGMNTTIELLADSSLTIYVDGNVQIGRNFEVVFNPQPDRPEDFVIYGTSNSNTVMIDRNTTFIGAIYAPNAAIQLGRNSEYTGSIIGSTIMVSRNSTITYDSDVLNIAAPVGGGGSSVVMAAPVQYFSY